MTAPAVAPAPLLLKLRASAKIEVDLNLIAWFGAFTPPEIAGYQRWTTADDEYFLGSGPYLDWQKPMLYAEGSFANCAEVSGGFGSPAATDRSEVDDWETPEVRRPYVRGERPVTSWTEQDYAALISAVPWLAAIDRSPQDSVELARTAPSPYDQPLFEVDP